MTYQLPRELAWQPPPHAHLYGLYRVATGSSQQAAYEVPMKCGVPTCERQPRELPAVMPPMNITGEVMQTSVLDSYLRCHHPARLNVLVILNRHR